jgi:signal transduction histidine kinase/HAMP domain-containing protein
VKSTNRAKQARLKAPQLRRLKIGARLRIAFVLIILAMLSGNVILLLEMQTIRYQGERLGDINEQFIVVLQARANLMSFYERLDGFAHSEDTARLVREAEPLRAALLEDTRRTADAFGRLVTAPALDPTLRPTLEAIQAALPAQLESITTLAAAADWDAVRLRLGTQVRELESTMSDLVRTIDREVGKQRTQSVLNIEEAQRRVFLIVPITATLSFLLASLLGLTVTRSIAQPLARLLEASKALGRGEFNHYVPIRGKDELANLAGVFNETAGTLRDLYAALSTREAYLSEAQRLSHTGSFGLNLSSGDLIWSDETFRIFGYSQTDKPTLAMLFQRTYPEDVIALQECVDHTSRGGTDWDLEHRLLMPDGSIKYVRSVAHAVTHSSGQRELVGAVVDQTRSKQAEQALRQAQADLAHVNRVNTMGELSASIAHELNQPITAAITNASTCLRWLARDPADVSNACEAVMRIQADAKRAADIIKHLKFLHRKKSPVVELESIEVNELVREMLALLRSEASRYSISMRTDLALDSPKIRADRVQLQQVLMNLMLNGIQAMRDTSGELTVRSRNAEGGELLISVSDSGLGLPAGATERIFEPFFTTKSQGTGMGLSICRRIVEAHGGRLWASANPERGATFHFILPSQANAPATSAV